MNYIAIESSCDETAVAIIQTAGKPRILSSLVSSQVALHRPYDGVVPELASRAHLSELPLLVDSALHDTGLTLSQIDGIAATRGPGLKGCLMIGYSFATALAVSAGKPFLGVNHIEGHLLASGIDSAEHVFPFLGLIVSGGHTEIVLATEVGEYKILSRTMDDAAGEAFDKAASQLGFAYPGGALLSKLAATAPKKYIYELPKVMRGRDEMSFSGLKTAIALLIERNCSPSPDESEPYVELEYGFMSNTVRASIARTIEEAITDEIIYKLRRMIKRTGVRRVVLTGGVAANRVLREKVGSLKDVYAEIPSPKYCTDNAAMIAHVAALRFMRGEITLPGQEVLARWSLELLSTKGN